MIFCQTVLFGKSKGCGEPSSWNTGEYDKNKDWNYGNYKNNSSYKLGKKYE